MKKIVFFLSVISFFHTSLHASKGSKTVDSVEIYTVKKGDSLSVIASRFHTTTKKLMELNRLKKTTLLLGQSIVVPVKKRVATKQDSGSLERSETTTIPSKLTKKVESKKREKLTQKNTTTSKKSKKSGKKFINYKVDKGDTLAYIARRFHVTKKEVALLNGLSLHKMPKAGKILKIPNHKYWSSRKERLRDLNLKEDKNIKRPSLYVVKSGDTLFSIARDFKTPIKELAKANNLKSTDFIRVGQKLKIPSKSYTQIAQNEMREDEKKRKEKSKKKEVATKNIYYKIKRGDTIERIARKTHVPLKRLLKINGITTETKLYVGRKILLAKATEPSSTSSSTTTTNTNSITKVAKKETTAKKKIETIAQVQAKAKDQTRTDTNTKIVTRVKKVPKKYVVKTGDNLWKIAKKYKISIAKLRRLNGLGRRSRILDGMVLTVGYDKKIIQERVTQEPKTKLVKKETKKEKVKLAKAKKIKKRKKKETKVAKNSSSGLDVILMTHRAKRAKTVSANKIIRVAKKYLGTKYVWGAVGPRGFDCSGFTQYVMRKSKGVNIPRVSRRQAYYGKYISRKNLKPGDLIFFDTSKRRRGYVNHVGIYIGNNKFIHASSAKHRVVITSLNRPFYRARFKWGRRIN
jgi:LysM repeat protein